MKRSILTFILILILISFCSISGYCDEYDTLWENTDEQTKEYLTEIGINELNFDELFELSPTRVIRFILNLALNKGLNVTHYLIKILSVLLISAIATSFLKENQSLNNVVSLTGTLIIISFLIEPISRILMDVTVGIKNSAVFIDLSLPIITSIIIATRNPTLALTYNSFSIYLSVIISTLADKIIVPVASSMLSFVVLSSFSEEDYKTKLLTSVRKMIIMIISFFSTIYTGVLTTKSILATSSDSVTIRGIKFISGTFIPIVGGNVADALSSVFSSFIMMKNTLGVFIIIVIILINLPIIIEMLLWYFILQLCSIISSLLGTQYITEIFENFSTIISLLNIVMFFITFILVITTGVVIMFGK